MRNGIIFRFLRQTYAIVTRVETERNQKGIAKQSHVLQGNSCRRAL